MINKLATRIPLFFVSLFFLSFSIITQMTIATFLYPLKNLSLETTLAFSLRIPKDYLSSNLCSCFNSFQFPTSIPLKPFVSHILRKPPIIMIRARRRLFGQMRYLLPTYSFVQKLLAFRWLWSISLDIPSHPEESSDATPAYATVNTTGDETPATSDAPSTDNSTKFNVFLESSSGSFVDVPITPPTSPTDTLSVFACSVSSVGPNTPPNPTNPFLSPSRPFTPLNSEGSTLVNEDSETKVKHLLVASTPKRRQPLADLPLTRTKSYTELMAKYKSLSSLLKASQCKIETSSRSGKENQPPPQNQKQQPQNKRTNYRKDTFMTALKLDVIPVGEGGFGQVFRATAPKEQTIAVKLMKRGIIMQDIAIVNEIQALKAAKGCKWAVELIYSQVVPEQALIALTYLPGGDMHSYWERSGFCLDLPTAQFYTAQLILAIHDLHSRGIIHRDIKLENMMLDSQRNLKLVDFGLAQVFDHATVPEKDFPLFHQMRKLGGDSFPLLWATRDNPHQTDLANGTEGYAPPEVWKCQSHSFGIDYFAMGCVLHMLITGNAPFEFNQTSQDYFYDRISVDNNMNSDAYNFLLKVLAPRPVNRLNVRTMKSHPVFRGIDWNTLETGTAIAPPYPLGH